MTANDLVGFLIQLGIPGILLGAVTAAFRAGRKRRQIIRDAPEQKIETSMARMQQATIDTDKLIDNLRDVVDVQTRRAESAEARIRAAEQRADAAERLLAESRRPRPN